MGAGGSSCGVAGRAALPWDPPLPWLYGGGYHLGRMDALRTALADTAQIMLGGLPPYLRAAIVPGQGGRLCRGTRPCPGSMAAVII